MRTPTSSLTRRPAAELLNGASGGTAVSVRGLSKHFGNHDQQLHVIDGVDLHLRTGEYASLIGPSGCGKSTVLRILSGLTAPDGGDIEVLDRPVSEPRTDVAFMFQNLALLHWRTVLDNVYLPAQLARKNREPARLRALEMLELVGLGGFEHHRPHQLSGGMRQRVALARILMQDATLWLLDEPLGSLDELTREAMDLLFTDICQHHGITALMVTHGLTEAVLMSDRVYVLSPRPARVVAVIAVPLPRPRTRATLDDPRFHETVGELRRALELGAQ